MRALSLSFVLLLFAFKLFSQSTIEIDKMVVYNTKIWSELDSSFAKRISVEPEDVGKIISIIKRGNSKKTPVYKPSANSLYGIAIINNKKYELRISTGTIFIAYGDYRHHFIKNKEDKDWLKTFILKYNQKLAEEDN